MASYRIADEPRPGALASVVVSPFWPLLGLMLGGAWLAWPWFLLNSLAVGSATRWREAGAVAAAVVGSAAIFIGVAQLHAAGAIEATGVRFGLLAVLLWKLGAAYLIERWQARSVEIFEHFRGTTRNGMYVVIAAFLADRRVVEPALAGKGLLRVVLE